jgi:hypothetical protein
VGFAYCLSQPSQGKLSPGFVSIFGLGLVVLAEGSGSIHSIPVKSLIYKPSAFSGR